jgi:hypothetical protein
MLGPGMLMRVERARWKDPINSIDWINVTDGELSVNLQRGLKYITAGSSNGKDCRLSLFSRPGHLKTTPPRRPPAWTFQ